MAITPGSNSANAIIDEVEKVLVNMALWDIHRALGRKPPETYVELNTDLEEGVHPFPAAFLLGCCLIEAAGHFFIGSPVPHSRGSGRTISDSQQAFERFGEEYLKPLGYDPVTLYKATRCGLAHSYSTTCNNSTFQNTYKLVHTKRYMHLQENAYNKMIRYINLQNFLLDLRHAIDNFLQDVRKDKNSEQLRFLAWAEDSGWLAPNCFHGTGGVRAISGLGASPPSRTSGEMANPSWSSSYTAGSPWNWGGTTPPPVEQAMFDVLDPSLFTVDIINGVTHNLCICSVSSGTQSPSNFVVSGSFYSPTTTSNDAIILDPTIKVPKSSTAKPGFFLQVFELFFSEVLHLIRVLLKGFT